MDKKVITDSKNKCLCVDVGGSAIKYGLIDSDLNLTGKGDIPTESVSAEAIWILSGTSILQVR